MHVGFLSRGDLSAEQQAAYDWCRDALASVERVAFDALAEGTVDPSEFDVLWWHRDDPIDDGWLAESATEIERAAESGTGLLLTLHALSSVETLGIDPTPPDATGTGSVAEPRGFLPKAIHADHPLFDEFDRQSHTRGPAVTQPFARYEDVLPEQGNILACASRGDDAVYSQKTVVGWEWKAGAVLGIGSDVAFADPTDDTAERNRQKLIENALRTLATRPETVTDRPMDAADLAALRASVPADHNRPRYHITPPANWLNDPNGLIQWDGRYHVFYQYNPAGPFHGTIHWGHAVSDDLIHWEDEPVALAPDPDGPDRDGCWSGCAVDDDGTPTFIYTGVRTNRQVPCLATADDSDLRTWTKSDANPLFEEVPIELDVLSNENWIAEFRDHCVWRENGYWYQLIGSGINDVGGTVILYRSEDLRRWTYIGPIFTGVWEDAGPMWECPELLNLGETSLLHVSNYADVLYFLGDLEDGRFHERSRGKLDHGDFYAPQSLTDESGRHLTFGWLTEARSDAAQWDAGWSGALSLPRELSLSTDGELRQRPVPEVRDLREEHLGSDAFSVEGERQIDMHGTALEIDLTIRPETCDACGLVVRATPDGEERTLIRYEDGDLVVDRSASSLDPDAVDDEQRMPVDTSDGTLSLRVFVDGSVVEVFANERRCLTSRIYPTRKDSTGLALVAEDGEATIERLDVWRLGTAWDELPSLDEQDDRRSTTLD